MNSAARTDTPDLTDELLARLSEQKPPEVIYHYTNPKGLLGIFASRSIWCTDIRFLNDSREVAWTLEFARNLLERTVSRKQGPRTALYDKWIKELWTLSGYPTFVASFSEEDDLLSQWRAYSAPAGYAIGFISSRVSQHANSYSLLARLIRCVYDEHQQGRFIEHAIERIGAAFEERGCGGKAHQQCTSEFFRFVLVAAAAFKHPKFAEEKEWRLVVFGSEGLLGKVGAIQRQFRAGPNTIVPYVDFPLANSAQPLAVKIVMVGPGPSLTLAGEALGLLMDQTKLPEGAMRGASTIPYRNW
jgi:hypothetical protein